MRPGFPMRSISLSLTLAAAMLGAALAACGGGNTPPANNPTPEASTTTMAPPPTTTASATGGMTPMGTTTTGATPPPPTTSAPPSLPPVDPNLLKPIAASTMAADLKDVGFDIDKLPPMAKMSSAQKGKVMKAISKATGMACKQCHVDGDYKKDTPNRIVARHMWDEYVVSMKLADGPLFCDSCHHGHDDIIPHDLPHRPVVNKFMDDNYVRKMSARDGGNPNACSTCHGASMEYDIFNALWKAGKKPHTADAPAAH